MIVNMWETHLQPRTMSPTGINMLIKQCTVQMSFGHLFFCHIQTSHVLFLALQLVLAAPTEEGFTVFKGLQCFFLKKCI